MDFFECNVYECLIDGNYFDWGVWIMCLVICGGGIRM